MEIAGGARLPNQQYFDIQNNIYFNNDNTFLSASKITSSCTNKTHVNNICTICKLYIKNDIHSIDYKNKTKN